MDVNKTRKIFLDFFEKRGHTIVSSSSLIPDDPSVLLTTAGMQQFKPYFVGKADPLQDFGSKNTISIQKSFRTSDIDAVGDEDHLTFFEMLGNFSFGGYFKKEAIEYAFDLFKDYGLKIDYVTVFGGDKITPRDEESRKIWESLKIKDIRDSVREDNFWGPTGLEGPCGPTTELYVCGTEVWNIVFNEYYCNKEGEFEKLETPGVDTGMGLERLAMVLQNKKNIFETDLFKSIIDLLPKNMEERVKRIIADHTRGIAFLISDGVHPSNKAAGYILRRLMRRVLVYLDKEPSFDYAKLFEQVVDNYGYFYPELKKEVILEVFNQEKEKFSYTMRRGLKELEKIYKLDAQSAFKLYESYGLPYEIIKEAGGDKAKQLSREDFDKEFDHHREISRAGAEAKFGGHGLLLDTGELKARDQEELVKVTRLHTATHLLQAALRVFLGDFLHQAGSDITVERTRFDFNFNRSLSDEEVKKVEDWVNDKIKRNLRVIFEELPYEIAVKQGALYFEKEKYPANVKVYSVLNEKGESVSKEFCGGPHVDQTGEMGNFKIAKQESVSEGVRRIRGILT